MVQWCPKGPDSADNNIGAGTVSGIINNYNSQLNDSDFDSIRALAMEIRKQGLAFTDLSSLIRLFNFFKQSSARQDQIEAFIAKVHSSDIPQDKIVEYVNQLYEISKEQSIPLNEVPNYIQQKLEAKQKIDQDIKEANNVLQTKNANIGAIEEHLKLKDALSIHELSTHDLDELVNLVLNAKENEFDSEKIVKELRSIERLEKRKNRAKKNYEMYSKLLLNAKMYCH